VTEVKLRATTSPQWIEAVRADFDAFLLDHAAAERKASAMAVSFVVQYPDKYELHVPMIRLAREELLHYQQVMQLIHERGLIWERDEKDPYIKTLLTHLSTDRRLRLLDRLLLGAVVEARGVERFGLVGEHSEDPEMAKFYARLAVSEANHASLFADLAGHYFEADEIEARLDHWLDLEAKAMLDVPARPALH
jgi:tRNA-(ms[2]io[6]A)-hydroxylase